MPSVLILQMPRFGRAYKPFEKIIPNLTLDISNLLSEGKSWLSTLHHEVQSANPCQVMPGAFLCSLMAGSILWKPLWEYDPRFLLTGSGEKSQISFLSAVFSAANGRMPCRVCAQEVEFVASAASQPATRASSARKMASKSFPLPAKPTESRVCISQTCMSIFARSAVGRCTWLDGDVITSHKSSSHACDRSATTWSRTGWKLWNSLLSSALRPATMCPLWSAMLPSMMTQSRSRSGVSSTVWQIELVSSKSHCAG